MIELISGDHLDKVGRSGVVRYTSNPRTHLVTNSCRNCQSNPILNCVGIHAGSIAEEDGKYPMYIEAPMYVGSFECSQRSLGSVQLSEHSTSNVRQTDV